jgi:hypothetical protein
LPAWLWSILPPMAVLLLAPAVEDGFFAGVFGVDGVLLDEDEPEEDELDDDVEVVLFAKPVVGVVSVGLAGFFVFLAFFFVVSADANCCVPWFGELKLSGADLPTVTEFETWLSWLADVVGEGESERSKGASSR